MSTSSFNNASAYTLKPLPANSLDFQALHDLGIFLLNMPNSLPRTRLIPELITLGQACAVVALRDDQIVGHAALLTHHDRDTAKCVEEVSAVMVEKSHAGQGLAGQLRAQLHHMGNGTPQVMFTRVADDMRPKIINRLQGEGWAVLPPHDPVFQKVESTKPKTSDLLPKIGFIRAPRGTVLALSDNHAAREHAFASAAPIRPAFAG